jgi:hypothetical protein
MPLNNTIPTYAPVINENNYISDDWWKFFYNFTSSTISLSTSTGIVVQINSTATVSRSITGTSPVSITNGDGISGNPNISISLSASDKLLGRQSSGAGAVEEITCTAAGRALIDDADATAQRTTLGLGTVATQNILSGVVSWRHIKN